MASSYAFLVLFIDTNFQKKHPNQRGRCPNTLDTALDPPLLKFRGGGSGPPSATPVVPYHDATDYRHFTEFNESITANQQLNCSYKLQYDRNELQKQSANHG